MTLRDNALAVLIRRAADVLQFGARAHGGAASFERLAGCCAPVRGAGAESTTGEKNSVMAPADPCSGALAGYVRACARARLGRNPLAVARTARSNAASRWA